MNTAVAAMTKEDLIKLAVEVWSSMANIALTPSEIPYSPSKQGYAVSSVQILGAWEGAVRLDIDMALARNTTALMLMAEADEISREELHDAAGELANMTGGGFKALLPQPCSLSLPSVVSGVEYEFQICHGKKILQTTLSSEFGNLQLTVLEKES